MQVPIPITDAKSLTVRYDITLADPGGGGAPGTRAPDPIFFIIVQFLGRIGQNNRLVPPPLRLAPHPLRNPGSATVIISTD